MSDDLRDLYQETILDHYKKPRNFGPLSGACRADGNNALCGDRVSVYVTTTADRVEQVTFEGSGCAICVASASMMTERLKGLTLEEARALFKSVHEMLLSDPDAELFEGIDDLAALAGVREYPMRVKCASLPWHALVSALEQASNQAVEGQP